jgi:chemotaxis family two-component system sensor kinase Cph1
MRCGATSWTSKATRRRSTDVRAPVLHSPPFGQADLTNCERELIHLAGSIQPHGVLLVLREPERSVVQASANARSMLGVAAERLLERPLAELAGTLDAEVQRLAEAALDEPQPLQCRISVDGQLRDFEGQLHRHAAGGLVVELEPLDPPAGAAPLAGLEPALLQDRLAAAVRRFSAASSIGVLADAAVQVIRDLTGFDRVMVYKFDPDGHGKIIAEARDPRLESLLGHHYPATDIPQRARELYLRNRVRVLSDAHYAAVPLQPRLLPLTGAELDMSHCALRSMSPLHLQYLKNMGVTATLVVSLVREGRLWGLVAAHHYAPRNLRYALRAACELLGEVMSTRIAAIENYAHAQVAILVRRLEQRLIEATSVEGDWRVALFRNPRTLLQPLEATGAALFHDGDVLTSGEVPSTPELRALLAWVHAQPGGSPFACASVARANPALESLTPLASGVMAVKLSTTRPDYLMWFRKEQLLTVTWAGDPTKPMLGNDPLELSPRRSFAAWSELVRGTAMAWTSAESALARAIGSALADIILQVHAVRLLIAEHQLKHTRATVDSSQEPVAIADAQGRMLFSNAAFRGLTGRSDLATLDDVAALFTQPQRVKDVLASLLPARQAWRGELQLLRGAGDPLPVAARAEVVPGRDGAALGLVLILVDTSDTRRMQAAREHLEQALSQAALAGAPDAAQPQQLIDAILGNASLAAMDIADGASGTSLTPQLLEEVEQSTRRAAALFERIRGG